MKYIENISNYDKYPYITFNASLYRDYKEIHEQLKQYKKKIICFECYPGTDYDILRLNVIEKLKPDNVLWMDEFSKSKEEINELFRPHLTEDRVFGRMNHLTIEDLYPSDVIDTIEALIKEDKLTIIVGFGASQIHHDILIYVDLARWEIQQRYRNQTIGNWNINNVEEDILRKYKRGYFIEWRIADILKTTLFKKMDYYIDGNKLSQFKMIDGTSFRSVLEKFTRRPFRLVPYFDPGVWGGQWMKEVCNLDPSLDNYAWSFDGVPEENSVAVRIDDTMIEIPAINIVLYKPVELLGSLIVDSYGKEFPIRFDFLDTMEGQNLSLQVHPVKEYIKKQFNMNYTQDESYYILDAKAGSSVYLGTKSNVKKEQLITALKKAQETNHFNTDKYINKIPVQKHDHILIPAGTIHCSGSGTMVLEISATPYIFTFKLWDWNRVGLDGVPRPIHINHGEKVIDFSRDTDYVLKNCINQVQVLKQQDDFIEERTGLHPFEPIETRRYWFKEEITLETNHTVNMLNLVEGYEVIITSPTNQFESYTIHYAETFIIPASIDTYTIKPTTPTDKPYGIIKAYIRER